MKKNILILSGVIMLLSLMGCADSVNVEQCINNVNQAGFWSGVWDGMITQFSFIGSLFSDDIAIYAVNNNGAWYDFGFVGGLFIMIRIISVVLKALFK
jgi:hypothetical protein